MQNERKMSVEQAFVMLNKWIPIKEFSPQPPSFVVIDNPMYPYSGRLWDSLFIYIYDNLYIGCIKQFSNSFLFQTKFLTDWILNIDYSDNPRYLKDKRTIKREDTEDTNHHEEEGEDKSNETTKRDSLDSGPFQKIDISRLRSPNIPFVGSGINKHEVQRFSIDWSESTLQSSGV